MDFSNISTVLILTACRLTPLFLSAGIPLFSRVPKAVRVILLLVLSGLFSGYQGSVPVSGFDDQILFYILTELLIGFVFVFSLACIYGAIDMIGKTIDVHMGFAAANVFNPFSGQTGSLFGQVLLVAMITILVSLNLHVELVRIIGLSYELVPIGELNIVLKPEMFISHLAGVFVFTTMLFIPVFSALLIVDIAVGMVSKSMPQMNVYFVTLPLKIFCGIVFMAITVRSSGPALVDLAKQATSFVERL